MATLETVRQAYALFTTTRPGADLGKVQVEACHMVLEPIPDAVLLEAAVKLSREPGDFLPGAGTLFQAALDILDPELPAGEAWTKVLKHAAHATLRDQNPVELPERAATALEYIGGDLGWTTDELPFRRKEFVDAYNGLAQRWRNLVCSGQLAAPDRAQLMEATDGRV